MTTEPKPPTDSPPPRKPMTAALIAAVVLAISGMVVMKLRSSQSAAPVDQQSSDQSKGPPSSANASATSVSGAPDSPAHVPFEAQSELLPPAFWVDVLQPKVVHHALLSNAWAKDVSAQPLGKSFLGSWAAFFGSKGSDLGGDLEGLVLTLFSDELMTDPYRVVWFAGASGTSAPAIIVPHVSGTAHAAMTGLVQTLSKGWLDVKGCPESDADDAGVPMEPIARIAIADQSLFIGEYRGRVVLSMRPNAVVQGLCSDPFELQTASGHAAELGIGHAQNGRALQGLSALLGVTGDVRLAFGVERDVIAPKGILVDGANTKRLVASAIDEATLNLVPVSTSVFVTFNVELPATLDAPTIKRVFEGESATGPTVKRQVVALWNPRGDANSATELAIIWGHADDERFIAPLFKSSKGALTTTKVCNHLVVASTPSLLEQIEQSCKGQKPSVLSAAPAIAAGLKAPSSIGLNVNLGGLLSQLTLDGFTGDPRPLPPPGSAASNATPPEIETARKQLEALPFLNWRLVVDEKGQLVLGGFRS